MSLTDAQRRYYEYIKGRTGFFHTNLFDLIVSADEENLKKLSIVYPEEVSAYLLNKKNSVTIKDIEMELARERCANYKREDGE